MRPRWQRVLIGLVLTAWLAAAGMVAGFCLGGLLGKPLFGTLGGHGLGDLGYLFGGALLGLAAGLGAGVRGSLVWEPARQRRVAVAAALGAALLAGATAVVAGAVPGFW